MKSKLKNKIYPNQIEHKNQTKSNQIKLNQIKSNKPNQIKPTQFKPIKFGLVWFSESEEDILEIKSKLSPEQQETLGRNIRIITLIIIILMCIYIPK